MAEGGDNSDVLAYEENRKVGETFSGEGALPPGASEEFTVLGDAEEHPVLVCDVHVGEHQRRYRG